MFYQKVRYLLENNIKDTLTHREENIITKFAEECISLYNKTLDRKELYQQTNLAVIRLVVEIFKPVLKGRQKMLDTLIQIFTKVRSLHFTILIILDDELLNQKNDAEENEKNAIRKIKLKTQSLLLITIYYFTPGHVLEKDINEYLKYREREVYGLDKDVSSTFSDILDEL